jgi:hypothetical protein
MLTDITPNSNAFASTFYFLSHTRPNAEKNKKSLQATAPDCADIRANLTPQTNGRKEERTDNMVLPQWGAKCFYETFVLKRTVVLLLSFGAKNPPLRQYPNRYKQP